MRPGALALPLALAAALVVGGCGGASDSGDETRAALEQRLARSSFGVCDGECTTFRARGATCADEPVELDGREWFRCRVQYRPNGGETPEPSELCAALGDTGYVARDVGDC